MSRSQIPRSEAELFRRENPLPNNATLYKQRREKVYPETLQGDDPEATNAVHARYTRCKNASRAATANYRRIKTQEELRLAGTTGNERAYCTVTTEQTMITPSGHRNLINPARLAADRELDQGRERRDAIETFPYMYGSKVGLERHHGYVHRHYRNSADYYEQEELHRRLSAATPPSNARDLYGREPTAGYLPEDDTFPPQFPRPGYYSSTRGVEVSDSDDEGFEDVGPRRQPGHGRGRGRGRGRGHAH